MGGPTATTLAWEGTARTTGFGTSSTERASAVKLIAAHARTITPAFCACVARRLEPPDFIVHKASH